MPARGAGQSALPLPPPRVALHQPPEMTLADPQKLRRSHAAQTARNVAIKTIQIPRHPYLGSHPDLPAFGTPPKTGQIVCY